MKTGINLFLLLCAPCVTRQKVFPTVGPAQILENPRQMLAWDGLLSAHEAGLVLPHEISKAGLPIPQLLMIPSPEAQASRFTKKTQFQKQISWIWEPTDLQSYWGLNGWQQMCLRPSSDFLRSSHYRKEGREVTLARLTSQCCPALE